MAEIISFYTEFANLLPQHFLFKYLHKFDLRQEIETWWMFFSHFLFVCRAFVFLSFNEVIFFSLCSLREMHIFFPLCLFTVNCCQMSRFVRGVCFFVPSDGLMAGWGLPEGDGHSLYVTLLWRQTARPVFFCRVRAPWTLLTHCLLGFVFTDVASVTCLLTHVWREQKLQMLVYCFWR